MLSGWLPRTYWNDEHNYILMEKTRKWGADINEIQFTWLDFNEQKLFIKCLNCIVQICTMCTWIFCSFVNLLHVHLTDHRELCTYFSGQTISRLGKLISSISICSESDTMDNNIYISTSTNFSGKYWKNISSNLFNGHGRSCLTSPHNLSISLAWN